MNLDKVLKVVQCAIADLDGMLPEVDPDGERTHPGWETVEELRYLEKELRKEIYT